MSVGGVSIPGVLAAAVTFYFTDSPQAAFAAYTVVAGVQAIVSAPTNRTNGPKLSDLTNQISSYGATIPILEGAMRFPGNIIWSTDKVPTDHTTSTGKGGASTEQTTTTYSASFAIAYCEGECTGYDKLWIDKVLRLSTGPDADATTSIASSGLAAAIRFYPGNETQLPDPFIEAHEGVGNASAFRGTCYLFFEDFRLTDFGNRIPQIEARIIASGDTEVAKHLYCVVPDTPGFLSQNDAASWVSRDVAWMVRQKDGAPGYLYRCDPKNPEADFANFIGNTGETYAPGLTQTIPMFAQMLIVNPPDEDGIPYQRIDLRVFNDSLTDNDEGNVGAPILHIFFSETDSTYLLRGRLLVSYDETKKIAGFALSNAPGKAYGDVVTLTGTRVKGYLGEPQVQLPSWLRHPHYDIQSSIPVPAGRVLIDFRLYQGTVYMLTRQAGVGGSRDFDLRLFDEDTHVAIDLWPGPTNSYASGGYVSTALCVNEFGAFMWTPADDSTKVYRFASGSPATLLCATVEAPAPYLAIIRSGAATFWTDGQIAVIGPTESSGSLKSSFWLIDFVSPSTDGVPLRDIVERHCVRRAITCDAHELTDRVAGFLIGKQMSSKDALTFLAAAYHFDGVPNGNQLYFRKRGGAPVATIPIDALAAHDFGAETPDAFPQDRTKESDVPQYVAVNFTDPGNDYLLGNVPSQRLNTQSEQQLLLDVTALAMTPTQAVRLAEVARTTSLVERQRGRFASDYRYKRLQAGDVVIIDAGDITYRRRIQKVTDQAGLLQFEVVADDAAAWSSVATASGVQSASTIVSVSDVDLQLLDIPILQDADDDFGGYAATAPLGPKFVGANIYNFDFGLPIPLIYGSVSQRGTIGRAVTVLADAGELDTWDEGASVTVVLPTGQAAYGADREAVEARQNNWLIGDEIVGVRNATLIAPQTYRFTGLLRRRRDTSGSGHVAGERAVLLAPPGTLRLNLTADNLRYSRRFLAVASGRPVDTGTARTISWQSNGKRPFQPLFLAHGQALNGDIQLRWSAQTRLQAPIRDAVGEPPGETIQQFIVEIGNAGTLVGDVFGIFQEGSGPARRRPFTVNDATEFVYTKAERLNDMARGLVLPAQFRVTQVSAQVGYGKSSDPAPLNLGFAPGTGLVFELVSDGPDGSTSFTDGSPYESAVANINGVTIQSGRGVFDYGRRQRFASTTPPSSTWEPRISTGR